MNLRKKIDVQIEEDDLNCSITHEIFFEPMMLIPCGHIFEKDHAVGPSRKCYCCSADIITLKPVPSAFKSLLENALSQTPKLYEEVYFNLDNFAILVANHELETPRGAKYIKLLQNAENHLNDKALQGKQKNKSAVELLVSCRQGRKLLFNDEKIRNLISPASWQLIVNGKTIEARLNRQKRMHGIFAHGNYSAANLTNVALQKVAYGKQNTAKKLIEENDKKVLLQKGSTIDYSDRVLLDVTPFQVALLAGDVEMCEMIKSICLREFANGQDIIDEQFKEIFPCGYAVCLQEQLDNIFNFDEILAAIASADQTDLNAALANQDNGSALCQALDRFRQEFTAHSIAEKIFNPQHFLQAFAIYDLNHYDWAPNSDMRDLFWRQVIGYTLRFLPACYAQAFAQGLYNNVDGNVALIRSFQFADAHAARVYFPLSPHVEEEMGFAYGVIGGQGRSLQLIDSDNLTKKLIIYVERKQDHFSSYASRYEAPAHKVCIRS